MYKYLISGTNSGFGKYLKEKLDGISYHRYELNTTKEVETIIHCGWDTKLENDDISYIFNANQDLSKLEHIKHKKFIFISTVDIYPKNNRLWKEDDQIDVRDILGIYGLTKYLIEKEVQTLSNYLILRCGALLGKYTKSNNLISLAQGNDTINISWKSVFNFIRYEQVFSFIKEAIKKDWKGIFNIVGEKNVCLVSLGAARSGYEYQTPKISTNKLLEYTPKLLKTSINNWNDWIKERDI